jgi:hypothetical protein
MFDGAVFPGSVRRLQHDEQGVVILGVEFFLQFLKLLNVFFQLGNGVFFILEVTGIGGVIVSEFYLFSGGAMSFE